MSGLRECPTCESPVPPQQIQCDFIGIQGNAFVCQRCLRSSGFWPVVWKAEEEWNRRAPTVTREEVAKAIIKPFSDAAGGCLGIQEPASPDDCVDGICPCMTITRNAADAIIALIEGRRTP